MQILDTVLVFAILAGAGWYLYRTFKPKPKNGNGCGCGSVDCKVPKPEIKPRKAEHKK